MKYLLILVLLILLIILIKYINKNETFLSNNNSKKYLLVLYGESFRKPQKKKLDIRTKLKLSPKMIF